MSRFMVSILVSALTHFTLAAPLSLTDDPTPTIDTEETCINSTNEISEKLKCLQGITSSEVTDAMTPSGARQFELTIAQPIDHEESSSEIFSQRLVLLHRNENDPMVLQTSGYSIFGVREATITKMFGTNQLQVEHRFFSNSKPASLDWSKLNIKQSADDFHRITVSLKKIYHGPWVNTGGSKGGMTSIYHRRFYPSDLVGTIADVAPLSYTRTDQRYNDFVNSVGGEEYKICRENFKKVQIDVLKNRELFLPQITGQFDQLGDKNVALEHATIESIFFFWQYGNPDDAAKGCAAVPINGTPQEKFNFISGVASLEDYSDQAIAGFMPYYYQAATQLGSPDNLTAHLEIFRLFEFRLDQYTPRGIPLPYSNAPMLDIEKWLREQADEIIFIYGQFDPWTAGEMPVSDTGKFVRKYYVPKGNHRSKFVHLATEDQAAVLETLKRWLQKDPVVVAPTRPLRFQPSRARKIEHESLEDFEFKIRKQHHL